MKILVVGARGLLGKTFENSARGTVHNWRFKSREDLNLTEADSLDAELAAFRPDLVVNCAGFVGGIAKQGSNRFASLSNNLQIEINLQTLLRHRPSIKYLNFGSSTMYPTSSNPPFAEKELFTGWPHSANEPYALAKLVGTAMVRYSDEDGLPHRTLVLSNIYGIEDSFFGDKAHLVPAAISKTHRAFIDGKSEVKVLGSPELMREFTYSKDVTEWVVSNLGDFESWPRVMNLASGENTSVQEVYNIASEMSGFKGRFLYKFPELSGPNSRLMDSTMARLRFNWRPKIDLRSGMAQIYESLRGTDLI